MDCTEEQEQEAELSLFSPGNEDSITTYCYGLFFSVRYLFVMSIGIAVKYIICGRKDVGSSTCAIRSTIDLVQLYNIQPKLCT